MLGEPPGNEKKEQELLEKMQKLGALLKQVDDLMDESTESRPSTQQSRPPPTSGGQSRPPPTASRPGTGNSAALHALQGEAPRPPGTGRSDFSTSSQRELRGLPVNAGIDMVQYQGKQSHVAGIQRLKKNHTARAAQSSIGGLLGGD